MISKQRADLGLLSVTVFWGSTFILSKMTLTQMSLPVFLFIRLTLAALLLNLYAVRYLKFYKTQTLVHGIILGLILYFSYFFQMWGIQFTSASNAGFITGLSVILVPLFGFMFYKLIPAINVLAGSLLAVIGLFLLTGFDVSAWSKGDILVFICAVIFAFHVIYTGKFAPRNNIYLLTAVQLSTVALMTMIMLPFGEISWPALNWQSGAALVYLALFGTVYTFLMQTSMQRYTTTARTALIFSMEPVFAALFAYFIAGEILGMQGWIGGMLIVAGMISAELPWHRFIMNKDAENKKGADF